MQLSIMRPIIAMITLLFMALLVVEGGAAASSSSASAFHGGHHGTHSVRRRVRSLPFTTTTAPPHSQAGVVVPLSFLSYQRSEITRMYKSKSDKDDDDSKSRSWFKPWRWFARRERRKRQPKLSPTVESLLYAFKEAKDLGIIKVNDNDGDSSSNTAVPSDRPIIIENTFVGNTYANTNQNGLQILPGVKFLNDMAGSFHNNNNAAVKYGNVTRQNGVADFQYSLRKNNNAVSKTGDVSRRNGVFAPPDDDGYYEEEEEEEEDEDDGSDGDLEEEDDIYSMLKNDDTSSREGGRKSKSQQQQQESKPASSSRSNGEADEFFSSLFGKQSASSTTTNTSLKDMPSKVDDFDVSDLVTTYMRENNATSWYEVFNRNSTNAPVVVRNSYIGNKYETATHNGLSLGVDIDFKNDMREAFYENNNAVAYEGNVRRQNGVADFSNALRKNNNAVSGSGDVERLNGVDDESLPLLVPLLTDLKKYGLSFLQAQEKKSKEQKVELTSGIVDYYKPKLDGNGKGKLRRLAIC